MVDGHMGVDGVGRSGWRWTEWMEVDGGGWRWTEGVGGVGGGGRGGGGGRWVEEVAEDGMEGGRWRWEVV